MFPRNSAVSLRGRYVARHSGDQPHFCSVRYRQREGRQNDPPARAAEQLEKGCKGNKNERATKRIRRRKAETNASNELRGASSTGRGGVRARSYLFLHRKRAGTDVQLAVTRVAEHVLQRRVECHTDDTIESVRRRWLYAIQRIHNHKRSTCNERGL